MKILLIFPGRGMMKENVLPLGIAYIGAYLKSRNHDVKICDMRIINFKDFKKILLDYSPECVGIHANTTNLKVGLKTAKFIKKKLPDCKVVCGGPHPTIAPKEVLKNKFVDVVVVGEGELTFLELVNKLETNEDISEVKGICYKKGKERIVTEPREYIQNLDILPFPTSILQLKDFLKKGPRFPVIPPSISMVVSRSCMYNCSFCQPTLRKIFGRKVRYRSVKNVIKEIKMLKRRYDIRTVFFFDDTLTVNRKWITKFCNEAIREKLKMNFICQSRVNTIDEELLKRMKRAGFYNIIFGIESGSMRILTRVLRKGATPEMNKKAMFLCKKLGLSVLANVMIGNPTEDENDIYLTYKLIKEFNPDLVYANITTPLPGTDLYDFCKKKRLFLVKNYNRSVYKQKIKLKHLNRTKLMKWKFKMQAFTFMPSKLIKPRYLKMTLKRWFAGIETRNFSMIVNDLIQGFENEGKRIIASLTPPLTYKRVMSTYRYLFGKNIGER